MMNTENDMTHAMSSVNLSRQTMEAFMEKAQSMKVSKSDADGKSDLLGLKENTEGLKKVASSFEGIFVGMLMKEMRSTVHDEGGIFKKSQAEEMFQDMLDQETAQNIGKTKSFGIADTFIKTYEKMVAKDKSGQANKENHINQIA